MENADEPESGKSPEKTPSARSTSRTPSGRGSASRKPAAGRKPAAKSKPAATGKPSTARKPAAPKAASTRSTPASAAPDAAESVEPTETIEPTETVEPTEGPEPTEGAEQAETAEPAENTERAANAERAEAAEQAESAEQAEPAGSADRAPFAVPRLSVPKISVGAGRRDPAADEPAEAATEVTDVDTVADLDPELATEAGSSTEAEPETTEPAAETEPQAETETPDETEADDESEPTAEPEPEVAEAGTDLEVASGAIAPPEYEPVSGADLVPVPMPADTDAMLSIRGLTKRFDDTVAVRAIDLDVPAGSIFGIVGPNGAGKTTTLSMITGLLRPDAGTVTVHGADVWAEPVAAKRQLGVLPDRLRLFDRLTGSQLLYYSAVLRGIDGPVAKQRVADLAAVFRIEDALGRLVSDYSTGMTKKVALAAAMIHAPRMLVLDEPFESVDPVSAATVMGILRDYVAAGGTVLLSSHSMALVERICDRVAVIVDGDVLAVGSIDEVRGDVSLEERFVQLAGSTAELEGVEWLHTFSD